MNLAWFLWFQKGGLFTKIHKTPISGTHGNKKWNDTYQQKVGKSEHEEKENGWDDDSTWQD